MLKKIYWLSLTILWPVLLLLYKNQYYYLIITIELYESLYH